MGPHSTVPTFATVYLNFEFMNGLKHSLSQSPHNQLFNGSTHTDMLRDVPY